METSDLDCRKINSTLRQLRARLSYLYKKKDKLTSFNLVTYKQKGLARQTITVDSPARKLIGGLKDQYSEQVEKLVVEERCPSLVSLAGFALGSYASKVSEDDTEEFYEMVPSHLRRFVLLQHITELIFKDTLILSQIPDFIDCCIEGGAHFQGFWLLKRFWTSKLMFSNQDYKVTQDLATKLHKINAWIYFQAEHLVHHSKSRKAFHGHAMELLNCVMEIYHQQLNINCYKALNECIVYLLEHWIQSPHIIKKRRFAISSDVQDSGDSSDTDYFDADSPRNANKVCICDKAFDQLYSCNFHLFNKLSDDYKFHMAVWAILMRPALRNKMVEYLSTNIERIDDYLSVFQQFDWKLKYILNVVEYCQEYPIVSYTLLRCVLTVARKNKFEAIVFKASEAINDLKISSPELCDRF